MQKRRNYTELPDIELSPDLDRKVRAMTLVADRHVAEMQAKARIRSLVLSFLRSRPGLMEYVDRFVRRWEHLKDLALENLAAGLTQQEAVTSALALRASAATPTDHDDFKAFMRSPRRSGELHSARSTFKPIYDRDDPIGMVVSVTSWAVLTETMRESTLADEAMSRGMPKMVAQALSSHVAGELSRGDLDVPVWLNRGQGR